MLIKKKTVKIVVSEMDVNYLTISLEELSIKEKATSREDMMVGTGWSNFIYSLELEKTGSVARL